MKHYSIAIDGPAGAGKSTIAKKVAAELGFTYIDTGAMYRALAVYFADKGIDRFDEAAIVASLDEINVDIEYINGLQHVILNGEDITGRLRTPLVGEMASATSAYAEVRVKLVELQRRLAQTTDVVMDGRDIASVVLPDADLKIYLTASVEERARRRCDELKALGEVHSLEEIMQQIRDRDHRDMHRANSPLVRVPEAEYLDTSDMDIDTVVRHVVDEINDIRKKRSDI